MAHGLGPHSHVTAFPTPSRSVWRRGFTWLLIMSLLLLDVPVPGPRPIVPDAEGSAFTAFGPEDFIRSTGAPVPETRTFTVTNPGLPYVLRLYNGGTTGSIVR